MDIGGAVEQLHVGKKVFRAGWNGKNMYLEGDLVPWVCSQTDLLAEDWGTIAT